MKKALFLTLCTASFGVAAGPTVYNGHWNNLSENGRGMNIDHQDGILVVDFYGYNPDGSAQWYQASGPTSTNSNGEVLFSAPMLRFKNGPCFTCSPQKPIEPNGDGGVLSIVFKTPVRAEVTLPGGHKTIMTPFYFGMNTGISNMKGYWYFNTTTNTAYSSSLVQFSNVSNNMVVGQTHTGNLIACQFSDSTLGTVVTCVEFVGSTNRVKMNYGFLSGIDKSYEGIASPNTNFSPYYTFDAYRAVWESGKNYKNALANSATATVELSAEQEEILKQSAAGYAQAIVK